MATGIVKWFDVTRGYGFIVPDDKSPDVFLHKQNVSDDVIAKLLPGHPVQFTVSTNDKGRIHAKDIVLLEKKKPEFEFKKIRKVERELDADELFEREWGLRRAI